MQQRTERFFLERACSQQIPLVVFHVVLYQQLLQFGEEVPFRMVAFLVLDVSPHHLALRGADGEGRVAILPREFRLMLFPRPNRSSPHY